MSETPDISGSTTPGASLTQSYVKEATPFVTPTEMRSSSKITQATQPPEDIVCMVDRKEEVFTNANMKAISVNLVNPPMYINYTIPDTQKGSYGGYASYYAITVRDKKTGTLISQSGFGKKGGIVDFQFGGSDVIKIMKSGELQIEKEGKDITIISEIWVKPAGNLDSSFDVKNAKCINWPQSYTGGVMHSPAPWGGEMNIVIDRT
jgi:hypothetical protein